MLPRAMLLIGAALIAGCAAPTEPDAQSPSLQRPAPAAVLKSSPTSGEMAPASQREPSASGAPIDDALLRLLPASSHQSVTKELEPLLREALRQIEGKGPGAGSAVLQRAQAKLHALAADVVDPDLAALDLALTAAR